MSGAGDNNSAHSGPPGKSAPSHLAHKTVLFLREHASQPWVDPLPILAFLRQVVVASYMRVPGAHLPVHGDSSKGDESFEPSAFLSQLYDPRNALDSDSTSRLAELLLDHLAMATACDGGGPTIHTSDDRGVLRTLAVDSIGTVVATRGLIDWVALGYPTTYKELKQLRNRRRSTYGSSSEPPQCLLDSITLDDFLRGPLIYDQCDVVRAAMMLHLPQLLGEFDSELARYLISTGLTDPSPRVLYACICALTTCLRLSHAGLTPALATSAYSLVVHASRDAFEALIPFMWTAHAHSERSAFSTNPSLAPTALATGEDIARAPAQYLFGELRAATVRLATLIARTCPEIPISVHIQDPSAVAFSAEELAKNISPVSSDAAESSVVQAASESKLSDTAQEIDSKLKKDHGARAGSSALSALLRAKVAVAGAIAASGGDVSEVLSTKYDPLSTLEGATIHCHRLREWQDEVGLIDSTGTLEFSSSEASIGSKRANPLVSQNLEGFVIESVTKRTAQTTRGTTAQHTSRLVDDAAKRIAVMTIAHTLSATTALVRPELLLSLAWLGVPATATNGDSLIHPSVLAQILSKKPLAQVYYEAKTGGRLSSSSYTSAGVADLGSDASAFEHLAALLVELTEIKSRTLTHTLPLVRSDEARHMTSTARESQSLQGVSPTAGAPIGLRNVSLREAAVADALGSHLSIVGPLSSASGDIGGVAASLGHGVVTLKRQLQAEITDRNAAVFGDTLYTSSVATWAGAYMLAWEDELASVRLAVVHAVTMIGMTMLKAQKVQHKPLAEGEERVHALFVAALRDILLSLLMDDSTLVRLETMRTLRSLCWQTMATCSSFEGFQVSESNLGALINTVDDQIPEIACASAALLALGPNAWTHGYSSNPVCDSTRDIASMRENLTLHFAHTFLRITRALVRACIAHEFTLRLVSTELQGLRISRRHPALIVAPLSADQGSMHKRLGWIFVKLLLRALICLGHLYPEGVRTLLGPDDFLKSLTSVPTYYNLLASRSQALRAKIQSQASPVTQDNKILLHSTSVSLLFATVHGLIWSDPQSSRVFQHTLAYDPTLLRAAARERHQQARATSEGSTQLEAASILSAAEDLESCFPPEVYSILAKSPFFELAPEQHLPAEPKASIGRVGPTLFSTVHLASLLVTWAANKRLRNLGLLQLDLPPSWSLDVSTLKPWIIPTVGGPNENFRNIFSFVHRLELVYLDSVGEFSDAKNSPLVPTTQTSDTVNHLFTALVQTLERFGKHLNEQLDSMGDAPTTLGQLLSSEHFESLNRQIQSCLTTLRAQRSGATTETDMKLLLGLDIVRQFAIIVASYVFASVSIPKCQSDTASSLMSKVMRAFAVVVRNSCWMTTRYYNALANDVFAFFAALRANSLAVLLAPSKDLPTLVQSLDGVRISFAAGYSDARLQKPTRMDESSRVLQNLLAPFTPSYVGQQHSTFVSATRSLAAHLRSVMQSTDDHLFSVMGQVRVNATPRSLAALHRQYGAERQLEMQASSSPSVTPKSSTIAVISSAELHAGRTSDEAEFYRLGHVSAMDQILPEAVAVGTLFKRSGEGTAPTLLIQPLMPKLRCGASRNLVPPPEPHDVKRCAICAGYEASLSGSNPPIVMRLGSVVASSRNSRVRPGSTSLGDIPLPLYLRLHFSRKGHETSPCVLNSAILKDHLEHLRLRITLTCYVFHESQDYSHYMPIRQTYVHSLSADGWISTEQASSGSMPGFTHSCETTLWFPREDVAQLVEQAERVCHTKMSQSDVDRVPSVNQPFFAITNSVATSEGPQYRAIIAVQLAIVVESLPYISTGASPAKMTVDEKSAPNVWVPLPALSEPHSCHSQSVLGQELAELARARLDSAQTSTDVMQMLELNTYATSKAAIIWLVS